MSDRRLRVIPRRFAWIVNNLFARLIRRLGPLYYDHRRDHQRSLGTHRELLQALEAGDPDQARAIVERMLGYSEERILAEADRLEEAGLLGPEAGG